MQGTGCWLGREGRSSPPLLGGATVTFLILKCLKCSDDPFPSFAEGSPPLLQRDCLLSLLG